MSHSKQFLDDLCDADDMPGCGPNHGEMPDYIRSRPTPQDDFFSVKARERVAAINAELKNASPPPRPKSKPLRPARKGRVARKAEPDCLQCGGPCVVETARQEGCSTWRIRCLQCTPA